jgi:precorrin-2 dehydrogenase/sirohydrochlorin ferrochelatase
LSAADCARILNRPATQGARYDRRDNRGYTNQRGDFQQLLSRFVSRIRKPGEIEGERMRDSGKERSKPVDMFPMFLKLEGRRVLVAGAGRIGEEKISGLLRSGGKVRVVAPQATRRVREWARAGKIIWEAREFRPADLEGAFLVVAATSSPELHEKIYGEARRRGVLCNIVDDPAHCDFYYPSVVRRGALQIAISTSGQSPALAQRLRKELESAFGAEYGEWIQKLGEERKRLMMVKISSEQRRKLLHRLASERGLEEFLREREGERARGRRRRSSS